MAIGEQKNRLLASYPLHHHDPSFEAEDRALCRQGKDIVERWENFLRDPERIGRVLEAATIKVGYGKETIARELIQNVDDAYLGITPARDEPAWVEFREQAAGSRRRLVVSHAARRFNQSARPGSGQGPDDLGRICGLGGSGKSEQHQIGRFGLGFKSVLDVAPSPLILSHPFSFRIHNVVVPEWVEPEHTFAGDVLGWHAWLNDPGVTRFVLESPAGREAGLNELITRLEDGEDLHPRSLLFLHRLRRVALRTRKAERSILRTDAPVAEGQFPVEIPASAMKSHSLDVRRLEVEESGRVRAEEFLVVTARHEATVPTASGPRPRSLQCAIALPWDSACGRFGEPLKGGERRLHLFLPTKTKTLLPFLIHGEFLTNLGRTDIDGDQEVNARLAGAIAVLVREVLRCAFRHWRGDKEALRSVYGIIPLPSDGLDETPWLEPIRRAFSRLLREDEAVVLSADGALLRHSECAFGSRLVHLAYARLLAADPTCPLKPLAAPEVEETLRRAQAGGQSTPGRATAGLEMLTGPALADLLFPEHLSRDKAVHRLRALLGALYEQCDERDVSRVNETDHVLRRLSGLPCFPAEGGGVARPSGLRPPDRRPLYPPGGRWADLATVAGGDAAFRRWIVNGLHWEPPPEPEPTEYHPPTGDGEVLLSPEARDRIWGHNLRSIGHWWSGLPIGDREQIVESYGLTGPRLWPIVRPSSGEEGNRGESLARALREDAPDHAWTWFRMLCAANIIQSGRRFDEGIAFLNRFAGAEFDGFRRLWRAGDYPAASGAVDALFHEAVGAQVRRGGGPEQATFWRRLYDFVKIRTLLLDRQFLEGFWDAADHHPEFLAGYLSRGGVPGERYGHRGLGESLSSQAFFVCRECFRLGVIRGDGARENCYAPNRHLIRFVREAFGPDVGDWPAFDEYAKLSHQLHRDVTRATGTRDFDDAFDLPLLHLALEDKLTAAVPGLVLRSDLEGVRGLLE